MTKNGLLHLILPSVSLSSIMLPLFIRLIRAEMKEVMETGYIKFARAKGLAPRRILIVHAFKNTLLPVIMVGGVRLGTMIAFTVLTETVFQWQGMGFIFLLQLPKGPPGGRKPGGPGDLDVRRVSRPGDIAAQSV